MVVVVIPGQIRFVITLYRQKGYHSNKTTKYNMTSKRICYTLCETDLKVLKSQVDGINQHMPIIDDKVFNMRFFKEVAIGLLL